MRTLALAGKPNAGKSTFFKAATMADVEVANYPFTTIDPNRGVSYVRTECPCTDLDQYCQNQNCQSGKRYVPITLIDVAGLVPGAHSGRGLGNQFLDELMDADVILAVIDASGATTEEGEPVEPGTYDPVQEIDFIETEIDEWITGIIDNNWETIQRRSRSPDFDFEDALTDVLSGLGMQPSDITATLRELTYEPDPFSWSGADRREFAQSLRKRSKPILLVANKIDDADPNIIDRLRSTSKTVIPATASGELALRNGTKTGVIRYDPGDPDFEIIGGITESQRTGLETIREVMDRWDGTGVQQALNLAVYDVQDQITVYPVENETKWTDSHGTLLPDAILLPAGSSPRDLAYEIHTDIGEGYLHAINARTNRRIGEEYELAEADVIKIVSAAS